MPPIHEQLRSLPAVNTLLETEQGQSLVAKYSHDLTLQVTRTTLEHIRQQIRSQTNTTPITEQALLQQVEAELERTTQPSLRPVINATGVIIHTNLGRAPLSKAAQQAVQAVGAAYSTLEFDLESGGRGSRNVHAEQIMPELTGAEAALVVNNAASALVLTLSALANGHEAVVSRGQLVEIGGGFRIPEIMLQSGAALVEVGTTNKTRPDDYQHAITEQTALLLRIHSSNFVQLGFVQTTSVAEMARVAHEHGVYMVDDIGSGALLDTSQFGLMPEPLVQDSIADGADLVLFSGDKLLGGPQAGIIVGKAALIDRLKRHPFARVLRADKMTLAALTATLEHYRRGEALDEVPIWWMMARQFVELEAVAHRWAEALPYAAVQHGESTVGGGSLPGATLPTALIALSVNNPDDIAYKLRHSRTPVITRIKDGQVLLDPRTVFPNQQAQLLQAVTAVLQ